MTHSFNALAAVDATTLTIATGVVTANQFYHIVAAETGTADDLATITLNYTALSAAGNTYRPMLIIVADSGDTITVKHGTGNISLISGADLTLNSGKSLYLFYTGSNWIDLGTSGGASGSSPLTTKGDVWGYSTVNARVPVGTNDYPLVGDSGAVLGVAYKVLPIAGGGTSAATKTAAFDALSPVTTRGDTIIRDASNNVRLAVGTANTILTSNGTDPAWSGALGRLQFVEEKTFVAAATTTSFTGLSGTNRYHLEARFVNDAASNAEVEVRINGDANSTDYFFQQLAAIASAVTAATNINLANVVTVYANDESLGIVDMCLVDGRFSYIATSSLWNAADTGGALIRGGWKNTDGVASITQIDLIAYVANGLGIDTVLRLYRVIT